MRKYLIPTLFLICSCNPLRHYQKVALDPFRNEKERALLAKAAHEEFPNTIDTIPQVTVEIDSSEVKRLNEEYAALVDSYVQHILDDDSSQKENHAPQIIERIKQLKPAIITKTVTKEVKIRDGAWAELKQNEVNACRDENRMTHKELDDQKTKNKNQSVVIRWMIGVWVLLLAFIIMKPSIGKIFPIM